MTEKELREILNRPFAMRDLEFRISRAKKYNSGLYVTYLTYITARALHERLDEAFGVGGWRTEFRVLEVPDGKSGIICRLWFRDPVSGEWCWRENGADQTAVESFKGGLSDAEKRAGAELGIGRYLYRLTENKAIISSERTPQTPYYGKTDRQSGAEAFYWGPQPLPSWALPPEDSGELPEQESEVPADVTAVADAVGGEAKKMADKDEVLAKVSAARAIPHLENIFRKYKSDAEAGGWMDDLVAACAKRKGELRGGE